MDAVQKLSQFSDGELRVMMQALDAAQPDVHSIMPLDGRVGAILRREFEAVLTLRGIQRDRLSGDPEGSA